MNRLATISGRMSAEVIMRQRSSEGIITSFEIYAGDDFIGIATTIFDPYMDSAINFQIIPGKVEKGINKLEFHNYLHIIEHENLLRNLSKRNKNMIKRFSDLKKKATPPEYFKISRGNSPHFNGEMKARLVGEFFPNNMEYFPVFKSVLL